MHSFAIEGVEVQVEGDFGAEGEPARGITYRASVRSSATDEEISALLAHTDTVVEIHNTVRASIPVVLELP